MASNRFVKAEALHPRCFHLKKKGSFFKGGNHGTIPAMVSMDSMDVKHI